MPAASDAVWVDVLPSMRGFGKALEKGAHQEGRRAGGVAGTSFGKAALAATAVVAGGAALATRALYNIGATFHEVENTIRVGTGATGDALEGLTESAKNIGRNVPASFDDIGVAVADLNTRLGLTGEPLEDMATRFLELSRITDTDLQGNIAAMTRVFGDWDVATEDQADTLDMLFRASQATGIGVDDLASKVVQFGSPLRGMGFSLEESAAMFGKFEKEGVNAELVIGALRQGLGRMAREGEDAPETFRRVVSEIEGMESRTEATAAAMELFGARAGPDMAAAIQEGRFELGDMLDVIENGSDTILDAAGDTMGFSEQWQMFKNNVMVDLAPVAKRVFDTITNGMTWMRESGIPTIREFGEWVQRSSGWLGPLAAALGGVVAAVVTWVTVSKALNAVLAIKNALLAANPIGLVVVAIVGLVAALVTAYKTSDTFRAIVDRAWTGVKAAVESVVNWFTGTAWPSIRSVWDGIASGAMWLWNSALKPAWEGIRLAVQVAIELIKLYWTNVLRPVFQAIASAASWLWNNVLQPVFAMIRAGWETLLNGIQSLWRNVLRPVWDAVATAASWLWNNVLSPVFGWIGDRWGGLLRGMDQVYTGVLRPMFDAVGRAVGAVSTAVGNAVTAIGRAWDGLKRAFASPVNWVIDNVLNKFLGWVNDIADRMGLSLRLRLVPNVSWGETQLSSGRQHSGSHLVGLNHGGFVPGGGPDRDSVMAHLTPGEFVFSRRAVQSMGSDNVAALHHAARNGQQLEVGDGVGGWIKDVATSALNAARKVIVDAARPGFNAALSLMDRTVGQWGIPGQVASGTARRMSDAMLDWMSGVEKEADSRTPELGPGIGWKAMWDAVSGAFPWARLTSAYRPGAITATGNPSMHGLGRAIDIGGRGFMDTAGMAEISRWIAANYGAQTKELIFSGRGGRQLLNGSPHYFTGITRQMHHDHVHWGYDQGGWLQPGVSQVANWTGKPEAVLTDRQWKAMHQAAQGGDGDTHINVQAWSDRFSWSQVRDELAAHGVA